MFTLRRYYVRVGLAVVALAGLTAVAHAFRYHVLPRRFRVVEPGRVFRGGQQQPIPLRRLLAKHHIRTIVSLIEPDLREQRIAAEMGVDWRHVPLTGAIPPIDELERAAAIVADPNNQPVYFHCFHGRHRSDMVHAVFRIKHCGYTLERTLAELRTYGFDPHNSATDRRRLQVLAEYVRRVKDGIGSQTATRSAPYH